MKKFVTINVIMEGTDKITNVLDITPYTFSNIYTFRRGATVGQLFRYCAKNREVAGSIPAGVNGFFIGIKFFRSHYGLGVDSVSNRNEYREYFLGVKAAGA